MLVSLRSLSASVLNLCRSGVLPGMIFLIVVVLTLPPQSTRAEQLVDNGGQGFLPGNLSRQDSNSAPAGPGFSTGGEDWITVVRGQSDVPPAPSGIDFSAESIGEEVDIFRERAQERARQQRREAKARKKGKAPPTFKNFFSMTTPVDAPSVSDGFGAIGRASYLAGKTFGRNDSILPLEVMPYMLSDEHFLFSDFRGFTSTHSRLGGSAGVGYRHLREDLNAWGGASVWYDADDTSSKLFQQIGLSFEALVQRFEVRSNVYLPISSSQTFSNSLGAERIVGNQLLYGQSVNQGTALNGVDYEIGYSMRYRDRNWLRGFVGGYHFQGGSRGDVNGFKIRVEGVVNNGVTAQLLYTNDPLYGSNVMAGVSLQLPYGTNNPTSGWTQRMPSPFRFVERNYNVIVSHNTEYANDKVAINPATGKPYQIEQVYEAGQAYSPSSLVGPSLITFNNQVALTGDGTTANPFNTLGGALGAGGDVIYVRSGSIINESVTLSPGQHLIGEGSGQTLSIPGGGYVSLPNLSQSSQQANATVTPRFEGRNGFSGPEITLASNTEVAGFTFNHTSGNAITGTNVSGISLHDLTFNQIGADAIHLTNSSGKVAMSDIQINSASGNGVVIDGGNANVTFQGSGNTITTQGDGFVLTNTSGGAIDVANLTLKGTGGTGLRLSNVGTDTTIESLNTSQTFGPAVAISGTTGKLSTTAGVSSTIYNTYNFTGYTTIASPNTIGFSVNGSDALVNVDHLNVTSSSTSPAISLVNASSQIELKNINVNTTNATGLYARGDSLLKIDDGALTTVNAPAFDMQGSTTNTVLTSVSTNGGPFGISLVQSQGNFTIKGNGGLATGGTIQNASKGLIINSFGNANISLVDFTNNGVAIQSNRSSQLGLSGVRITGSSGYAIDSMDDTTLILSKSQVTGNGALGGGSIRIQADANGTYNSQITNSTIIDSNGTAIQYMTTSSGAGASLATAIQSNSITSYQGGTSVINSNWSGPQNLLITNNQIYAQSAGMTGVFIQDPVTTASVNAQVSGNTMSFASSQGTGVSVIAAGTSVLNVTSNNIEFKGVSGIGTRFALSGTSTDYIASNIITDRAGGATGMLFDNVAANSRLQIDGNTINLLSTDLTLHQGIIFTNVSPTIQFLGTVNNLIYNAASPQTLFSAPVNSFTGGFYINGILE